MSSIFSRIIAGDIPGSFVAQEANWVALLDRFPAVPGHLLLIPRYEAPLLADLPTEVASDMGSLIGRGTTCLYQALNCDAVSVLVRDGAAAGQEVPHVHIHLIPRYQGGTNTASQAHHFASGSYGPDDDAINAALAAMASKLQQTWPTN